MNNKFHRIAIVSNSLSRKDYSYLPGFMYLPPTGLIYIDDLLKTNGFSVATIKPAGMDDYEDIGKAFKIDTPEVVLFNQYYSTRKIVENIIKMVPPGCIIGIGGHDITFHSRVLNEVEFRKQYQNVNFIWQGEAENALCDYLNGGYSGTIPELINNLPYRIQNLDDLPVLKHDNYTGDMGFLVTSRGCYKNGCDFCTTPSFYPDGWRTRSTDHVKREINNLKKQNKKMIWIFDDNFFGFSEKDHARGLDIVRICRTLDLKVGIMATVDQIIKLSDRLKELNDTILVLFVGVENGNAASVEYIGKACGHSEFRENCKKAVKIISECGIYPYLGYINFHPFSSVDDLADSAEFLFEINQSYMFHNLYSKLAIFEGTKLFERHASKKDIVWKTNSSNDMQYSFSSPIVNSLFGIISMVVDITNVLDFLIFELSVIINHNCLQDDGVNKKFMGIKEMVNRLNYNYFKKNIELCKNNADATRVFDTIDDFRKQTASYIYQLLNLYFDLQTKCKYISADFMASISSMMGMKYI